MSQEGKRSLAFRGEKKSAANLCGAQLGLLLGAGKLEELSVSGNKMGDEAVARLTQVRGRGGGGVGEEERRSRRRGGGGGGGVL